MNQTANVTGLGKQLAGDMPQGSDHLKDTPAEPAAPAADKTPPAAAPAAESKPKAARKSKGKKGAQVDLSQFAHLRDKHGFKFDPEVHKVNRDGTPKVTGDGLLWRKPGKRPAKSKSVIFRGGPDQGTGTDESGHQPQPGTESAHYQAAGAVMAETIFSIGQMFMGREWAPVQTEGMDERAAMADAWAQYFRAKGIHDIPPGVAVSIAMASYALPRLALESTRTKMGRMRSWWANRKRKKAAPPKPAEKDETTSQADNKGA